MHWLQAHWEQNWARLLNAHWCPPNLSDQCKCIVCQGLLALLNDQHFVTGWAINNKFHATQSSCLLAPNWFWMWPVPQMSCMWPCRCEPWNVKPMFSQKYSWIRQTLPSVQFQWNVFRRKQAARLHIQCLCLYAFSTTVHQCKALTDR